MVKHPAVPYSFLNDLLNILIVDDDADDRQSLLDLLRPASCFTIHTATSTGEALTLLRGGRRFHCCITELGLDDVESDEFYIVRHYAQHSSVIIRTGAASAHKGATCAYLGARGVLDKESPFDRRVFFDMLTGNLLINIVNHRYSEHSNDTLNMATRTLLETAPKSVTEWADRMRITDRQLRNLWQTGSGFGVKHILFLFECFSRAFAFYKAELFGTQEDIKHAKQHFLQRHDAYFNTHRELLTFILS
jgi:CheY-like chemotaxis protein